MRGALMGVKQGLIFDIDRFAVHDGPGIRAAVFLKGCPLSCKWCHSPESQKPEPELIHQNNTQKICGVWHAAGDILETLLPDKPFYINSGGGITVTGGEPLMQPEFTLEFLTLCKQAGIHAAIETCGFGNRNDLLKIAEVCDLIYYDIKIIDDVLHKKYTGVSNALILDNLAALCENNTDKIIVRIPCIPGITDRPEQIAEIKLLAKKHDIKNVELMPYNTNAGAKYEWLGRTYELNNILE
jgi:pyruvate formate lyase activating enzyme